MKRPVKRRALAKKAAAARLPISPSRLDELRDALFADRPLRPDESGDLLACLNELDALVWRLNHPRRRGAPRGASFNDADLVRQLVNIHGCTLAEATWAIIPDGTQRDVDRLQRAYRKSKAALPRDLYLYLNPPRMQEALQRLQRGNNSQE